MNGINQAFAVGNITKAPESRVTRAGKPMLTFTVAVNESWTDDDGATKTRTEWVSVVCFDRQAEALSRFLGSGMLVAVLGKMRTDRVEKDGVVRFYTKVIADRVQVLSPKAGATTEARDRAGPQQALDALDNVAGHTPPADGPADYNDDEIPF